ncbi:GAF domain-containing protein [Nocardioides anomalus]|uniref:Sensor-like histidine kinase SenX3 n=1 Tax=Nocardioides anomalus TaxID=2712223 RepID=A0A6G6WGC9_9ACTN|nr:ATP-binding protein [Nocardioides anomalus]QIG44145.1 GAF domain-containing protein [Nocardioides anomalus]
MWRECGVGGQSFDHYARLVRRVLGVSAATVSLVEADRQVLPGAIGLPAPYDELRETPLTHSFCRYVVADQLPLVVSDARTDPRLATSPAVTDMGVVAYAGWPVRDASGRVVGSLCAIESAPRDWSADDLEVLEDLATACSAELQHTVRMAEDSESLTRAVFEAAPVAMAFHDADGRPLLVNSRAERALAGEGATLLRRALEDEVEEPVTEWVGPPGRRRALVPSSRRIHRADGTPWGTLVVAQDVTALARAVAVKDEFMATVSHELRTPLTSIAACVELLSDEVPTSSELAHQLLERMERAAANLHRRIDQLLLMGDRHEQLVREPTDLARLCRLVRVTFTEAAVQRGVALRVEDDGPQWAEVDARRVEQALENLMANALKYTPPGGHVTVTVRGCDDAVDLEFADDGVGMDADEVEQAFDLFWRADSSRRSAVQGLGLGLTLVREIARQHHGTVRIESALAEGTRVVLHLPRGPVTAD